MEATRLFVLCLLLTGGFTHAFGEVEGQQDDCSLNLPPGRSCIYLKNHTESVSCFGETLTNRATSYLGLAYAKTYADTQDKLKKWLKARTIKGCWSHLQPLLCSVYFPICTRNAHGHSSIVKIPRLLCTKVEEVCPGLIEYAIRRNLWPEFLHCENEAYTNSTKCQHVWNYTTVTFRDKGVCQSPLLETASEERYFEEFECGLQCNNPAYSDSERSGVHIYTGVLGALSILVTLFAVLTFAIDWKNTKGRYPATFLLFVNGAFLVSCIGWMAQFSGSAREDIVCRADGTVRRNEPDNEETESCAVIFFVTYYFTGVAVTWFAIFSFSWYSSYKRLRSRSQSKKKQETEARPGGKNSLEQKGGRKVAYFHIVAWCLPLVLAIVTMAAGEVDGDSLRGVCFVGYSNGTARGLLLLLPIVVGLGIGLTCLALSLHSLMDLYIHSLSTMPSRAAGKIRRTMWKLGVFLVSTLIFGLTTFVIHIYDFAGRSRWDRSISDYVYCLALEDDCTVKERASLIGVYLHLTAFFGAGLVANLWVIGKGTVHAWRRFLRLSPGMEEMANEEEEEDDDEAAQPMDPGGEGRRGLDSGTGGPWGAGLYPPIMPGMDPGIAAAWLQTLPSYNGSIGPEPEASGTVGGSSRHFSESDMESLRSYQSAAAMAIEMNRRSRRRHRGHRRQVPYYQNHRSSSKLSQHRSSHRLSSGTAGGHGSDTSAATTAIECVVTNPRGGIKHLGNGTAAHAAAVSSSNSLASKGLIADVNTTVGRRLSASSLLSNDIASGQSGVGLSAGGGASGYDTTDLGQYGVDCGTGTDDGYRDNDSRASAAVATSRRLLERRAQQLEELRRLEELKRIENLRRLEEARRWELWQWSQAQQQMWQTMAAYSRLASASGVPDVTAAGAGATGVPPFYPYPQAGGSSSRASDPSNGVRSLDANTAQLNPNNHRQGKASSSHGHSSLPGALGKPVKSLERKGDKKEGVVTLVFDSASVKAKGSGRKLAVPGNTNKVAPVVNDDDDDSKGQTDGGEPSMAE